MKTTEFLPEEEGKQHIRNTDFVPGAENGKFWLDREEISKSRRFYYVMRRGQDIFFSLRLGQPV